MNIVYLTTSVITNNKTNETYSSIEGIYEYAFDAVVDTIDAASEEFGDVLQKCVEDCEAVASKVRYKVDEPFLITEFETPEGLAQYYIQAKEVH